MFDGLMTETQFINGASILLGTGLIASGVLAIRRRQADVPER
jgi:hypothetical protein